MLKVMLIFILIGISVFSEEELKFEIQRSSDNKKIEVILEKNIKDNLQVYVIQPGETLSELALKLNNNIDDLIELNNIKDKNIIIQYAKLNYYIKEVE